MGLWADGMDEALTPYTVSKHGVVAMTRSMSLSHNNIMHKAICPDTTDTELVAAAGKGLDPKKLEEYYAMTGGLMTPEFVAEAHFVIFEILISLKVSIECLILLLSFSDDEV